MEYTPLTENELNLIKNYKNNVDNTYSGCLMILPIIVLIPIGFVFINFSSFDNGWLAVFIGCSIILIIGYFLYVMLTSVKNYVNPLIIKELDYKLKIVGNTKISEKIEIDNSDSQNYYLIKFEDDRVKSVGLKYEFWKKINQGDFCYIEQSKYFGFLFEIKINGFDVKEHLERNQQYFN